MNGSGRISAVVPLLALTALLAGCATPFQKRLAEAQKGDCRAQYDVALCYATGRGVGPKGTKGDPSPEEAVRWLEQAADKDGEACLALGLFHYYRRGVRDDWDSYQKAFYHIRRASERNVPGALYWLGECYLKGRDWTLAQKNFERALQLNPDRMDAWYLSTADMIHTEILLVCRILLPRLLTIDIFHDFIS